MKVEGSRFKVERIPEWTKVIYLVPGDLIAVSPSPLQPTPYNLQRYVVWDNEKVQGSRFKVEWEEIASIEYVGMEQVYDITVEGTENFFANGILAHNTYLNGNVGIGTTGPNSKLEVSGGDISIASGQKYNLEGPSGDSYLYYNTGSGWVNLYADNAVNAYFSSTNTHFYRNVRFDELVYFEQNKNVYFDREDATVDTWMKYDSTNDRLDTAVDGTTALTIKAGGNVGIGTTAPAQKLEVDGHLRVNQAAVFDAEYDNGSKSAAFTVDWTNGNKQKVTLAGASLAVTLTAPPGPCNIVLKIVQDATGSRTVSWPASCKWAGGSSPTLSTGANAVDIVTFYYDGTNYYGQAGLNFS